MPSVQQTEFSALRLQTGLSIPDLAEKLDYHPRQLYRWENGESMPRAPVLEMMRSFITGRKAETTDKERFTFIDLFAGIGGLRKGFDEIGGHCVFTSEWNKYAQQTYAANFHDDHPITGDIRLVKMHEIPDHDVLLAGFPCQPFSIAGVSKKNALGMKHGFACEAQGTLFFDVARILKDKRPPAFLLENVKNLKSHDKGNTFRIIMKTLRDDLGYHVHERIIDARHFLPQHRQRIVIVGFQENVPFSWDDLRLPEIGTKVMRSILHPEDGTEYAEGHYTLGNKAHVNDKYTLTPKLWDYLQNYAVKHKAKGNGFGFGLVTPEETCRTLSARYYKDGSEILINRGEGLIPRRLTPRECARLMGYDDKFVIPVSDMQAYKQFGNSVAVPVFREVARIMQPHIIALTERERSLSYRHAAQA
jgi:DNA (cytosine-5)-methyltransferase 1